MGWPHSRAVFGSVGGSSCKVDKLVDFGDKLILNGAHLIHGPVLLDLGLL